MNSNELKIGDLYQFNEEAVGIYFGPFHDLEYHGEWHDFFIEGRIVHLYATNFGEIGDIRRIS